MIGKPRVRIFTLEIGGKPTVSFVASVREAQELLKEAWLLEDLRGLTSEGNALWDGSKPLRARPASEHEAERYRDIAAEVEEEASDILLAFLVTLDGTPKP